VARQKADGLQKFYDVDSPAVLAYFEVHAGADIHHRRVNARLYHAAWWKATEAPSWNQPVRPWGLIGDCWTASAQKQGSPGLLSQAGAATDPKSPAGRHSPFSIAGQGIVQMGAPGVFPVCLNN
jgi:hypothetical protein